MDTLSISAAISYLPAGLRLRLAKFALWRLKHGKPLSPKPGKGRSVVGLSLCMIAVCGSLYLLISPGNPEKPSSTVATVFAPAQSRSSIPQLGAAMPSGASVVEPVAAAMPVTRSTSILSAAELGELQAEIVRLRVLFLRLAEMADLNDGEFDLDMQFGDSLEQTLEPQSQLHQLLLDDGRQLKSVALVNQALDHISEQAERMHSIFLQRRISHDFRNFGRPVEQAHISSRYGYRLDPASGRRQMHRGLDFSGERGSSILAMADGVVTYAGENGGYGQLVELEHAGGYRTRYAHNDSILVPLGQPVKKGQSIATMGSTGKSTGTHVHVEVRYRGGAVDPQLFIR